MDKIDRFAATVVGRLRMVGVRPPRVAVVAAVFRTVQTASLITEEGHFVSGSVTYASTNWFDIDRPALLRADYPRFTQLQRTVPFRPAVFVKLARAVDKWSGSVAVYGTSPQSLAVWGLVDQQVGTNVSLNRESIGGFGSPGVFTVVIERPGDFAVYHSNIFLGALRSQFIVLREVDALDSLLFRQRLIPTFSSTATAIRAALPDKVNQETVELQLFNAFSNTIARICIGLRHLGSGGALLITPKARADVLSIGYELGYDRLRSSVSLHVLDQLYKHQLDDSAYSRKSIHAEDLKELLFAQADAEDRVDELNGAVKFVTSLAALDGATLLTPDLQVTGFGIKIKGDLGTTKVYDGEAFSRRLSKSKTWDLSQFGTRHLSVLSYCKADPSAIGVVVSQDGHARIVMTSHGRLLMWNDIQLLNHINFSAEVAKEQKLHRKLVKEHRREQISLGYSQMPKTMADLLSKNSSK